MDHLLQAKMAKRIHVETEEAPNKKGQKGGSF